MKFGRVLRTTSEDLPDVSCIFESYKQLKKLIKAIPDQQAQQQQQQAQQQQAQQQQQQQHSAAETGAAAAPQEQQQQAPGAAAAAAEAGAAAALQEQQQQEQQAPGAAPSAAGAAAAQQQQQAQQQAQQHAQQQQQAAAAARAEDAFIASLGRMLAGMNDTWLEKEETSVIRVEALEGALAAAGSDRRALASLHQEFVDFHGEVLLLVHWSILAYTATVKLLKKHHKRTGLLLRAPLGNLLSQPFCSTEMMQDIAHRVEADITFLTDRMRSLDPDAPRAAAARAARPAAQ